MDWGYGAASFGERCSRHRSVGPFWVLGKIVAGGSAGAGRIAELAEGLDKAPLGFPGERPLWLLADAGAEPLHPLARIPKLLDGDLAEHERGDDPSGIVGESSAKRKERSARMLRLAGEARDVTEEEEIR
jgi:hypothetical protein